MTCSTLYLIVFVKTCLRRYFGKIIKRINVEKPIDKIVNRTLKHQIFVRELGISGLPEGGGHSFNYLMKKLESRLNLATVIEFHMQLAFTDLDRNISQNLRTPCFQKTSSDS